MPLFNIDIVVSHKDCLDGSACTSIIYGLNTDSNIVQESYYNCIYTIPIFIHPTERIFDNIWIKYFMLLISMLTLFIHIHIIITDVLPVNIIDIVRFYAETNIKLSIFEHHKGNTDIINIIKIEENIKINKKLNDDKTIEIMFEPDQLYGATYLLMNKYKHKLSENQIYFYTKWSACDMWNADEFPDFIYMIFGTDVVKQLGDGSGTRYDTIWDVSFYGKEMIDMYVSEGKNFYTSIKSIIDIYLDINIKNITYNLELEETLPMLMIDLTEIEYLTATNTYLLPVLNHYIQSTKNEKFPNIKFIGFYHTQQSKENKTSANDRTKYASLRAIQDNVDVSSIARQCGGNGHVKAAGCETKLLWQYISKYKKFTKLKKYKN